LQPFVVSLTGLKPGTSVCSWHADGAFFELFGNTEILAADVAVEMTLRNHGLSLDASCKISGSVTVECDRCLEELVMPVEVSFEESYSSEGGESEIDLSQDIYDYICTSLPMQRVHPDGECNQETTKYLSNNN